MTDSIPLFLEQNRREVYYVSSRIEASNGRTYVVDFEKLGNGGNAVVHKCVDYISGEEYAIKFQVSLKPKRIARFKNEITLLQDLEHDQLIKYITHGECDGKYTVQRQNRQKRIPFLIMSLASKSLKDYLQEKGKVDFTEYIAQFQGLAAALAEVHRKAIHRDIKPENILVSGETWLLSDFGLCKFLEEGDGEEDLTDDKENVGPKFWMSPEALNRTVGNKDEIMKCSDVYQLCSVFWYIVNKRHPSGVLTKEDWSGPPHIFDVIYNSLSHDPSKRPCDGEKLLQELYEATMAG